MYIVVNLAAWWPLAKEDEYAVMLPENPHTYGSFTLERR